MYGFFVVYESDAFDLLLLRAKALTLKIFLYAETYSKVFVSSTGHLSYDDYDLIITWVGSNLQSNSWCTFIHSCICLQNGLGLD